MKAPQRLAVNELESMMEGGCGMPGCTCRPDVLYLTQRCHSKAGTVTAINDDILTVSCVQCSKVVAEVVLMRGASKQMRSLNRRLCACPTLREPGYKGLSVSYRRGTGELTLECNGCQLAVDKVTVALLPR